MAKVQNRKKRKLLEELEQMPIVQIACKRVGIPRSTYYRWCQEDEAFATQATEALSRGVSVVSDVAESKVISGVNNGEQKYVIYWLDNRHLAYGNAQMRRVKSETDGAEAEYKQKMQEFEDKIRDFLDDDDNQPDHLSDFIEE